MASHPLSLAHRSRTLLALAGVFLALPAQGHEIELILDASNSMWNKLDDGQFRINAAKAALGDFLTQTQPQDDLHIGLRIYGSRVSFKTQGACKDSVLLVPISGFEREKMLKAVREARAIGATPIAYSLELSGNDFSRDGKKSIILFTDGEESCGGDVQATLQALKAKGIDVDLRIIGIGLSKGAVERFSKIAPIINANNAAGLAEALNRTVAETAEVKSVKAEVVVTAKLVRDGAPYVIPGAQVEFHRADEEYILEATEEATFSRKMPVGLYRVGVRAEGLGHPRIFEGIGVIEGDENIFTFDVSIPPEVTLTPNRKSAAVGSQVEIAFEGARGSGKQRIVLAPVGDDEAQTASSLDVEGKTGKAKLTIPPVEGRLEARFYTEVGNLGEVLAGRSEPIEVEQVSATLEAPAEVPGGLPFAVSWTGPAAGDDFIVIVPADEKDHSSVNSRYTLRVEEGEGSDKLNAPYTGGKYELRYVLNDRVIGKRAIAVVAPEVSLTAPDSAPGNTDIEITWKGPGGDGDYVTIVESKFSDSEEGAYFYVKDKNPQKLRVPATEGAYELRYIAADGTVLHRRPITIGASGASLKAVDEVSGNSRIAVEWTGPASEGDFVTVVEPSAREDEYGQYFYVEDEGKSWLTVPVTAGNYELRYVGGSKVLAQRPLKVTAASAELTAPDSAKAGATIKISFKGPAGKGDFITVVKPDAEKGAYNNYFEPAPETTEGEVELPSEAGKYEIRYVIGQNGETLARRKLTIE